MGTLTLTIIASGLSGLQDGIIRDWIGPVFLLGVAAFAIVFIKDRAWMKLIGFVGIAAVVGVLIFAGGSLFGDDGALKNVAESTASGVGQ